MTTIDRRALLAGSAAVLAAGPALAAAPKAGVQGPGVYRYRLGDTQLTAIDDGTWFVKIDDDLVRNADTAAVNRALAAAFLPPNILPVSFTVLLVNTGSKLVMIDAGTGGQIADTAGVMLANLAVAGIEPKAVDAIVISHFHPDHINGIKTKDGEKVFPNAEILVPEPEWTFWMDEARMNTAPDRIKLYFRNARRIFADLEKEVRRFRPGAEVAPGITSIPAFGHTPGHTAFSIASRNQSMLVMGDAVRNPYLFARHPDWQPAFDMDGALGAKTRRQMLDRAAADRMLVEAYHFPFPACGHIARSGKGYELVPAPWQPLAPEPRPRAG
ncbi:MAG: MBL fold metallo-hydrolase [Xanthobacteraceae bacterium]|nr:MBL fold metallo-hydrolase [Xanthobacteraceae bacterium]